MPNAILEAPSARPCDPAEAESYCARLARSHYENFAVGSLLLPAALRRDFYHVYAFCRSADDLGDESGSPETALARLAAWGEELRDCYEGRPRHPVFVALRGTIERHGIPREFFEDLIGAFERDQRQCRWPRFEDLLDYCRGSANPVGRIALWMLGYRDPQTQELSDAICTGLQLANFWQDVRVDLDEKGRIYIPEEDLRRFGVSEEDLHAGRCDERFRELMRFEVGRARGFFERGALLGPSLSRRHRVEIELFRRGGMEILRAIESRGYDVFRRRPRISKARKARIFLGALLRPGPSSALEASRGICRAIARREARNFHLGIRLLPREKREALYAVYSFLRRVDDAADGEGAGRGSLERWKGLLREAYSGRDAGDPILPAFRDAVTRFEIPCELFEELIRGAEMDLSISRYESFEDLYRYCYRVASVVGLIVVRVVGSRDPRAEEYAEKLGIAFQLTNILRDVKEDAARGRIYVPLEDLRRFGVSEEEFRSGAASPGLRPLMAFECERAQSFYERGERLLPLLERPGRAAISAMARIYRGLLGEIRRRDYDVWGERASLSLPAKLRRAAAGWVFPSRIG